MGFIGKQPSKTAITSSDITDGVVTAAKLASDSVTTAKIADTAVTTAKITDANITTAKIAGDAVTDAKIADDVVGSEHLTAGEVDTTALGADAVTAAKIADDAISEEHLDATVITGMTELAAEPADTDEFLISDAGTLKRIDYSHIKGGGITQCDNWRINTNLTGLSYPGADITANWERADSTGQGSAMVIGDGMSESSGVFTFPATGIYLLSTFWEIGATNHNDPYIQVQTLVTTNNSSYGIAARNGQGLTKYDTSTFITGSMSNTILIDVADTSNTKVKFYFRVSGSNPTLVGSNTEGKNGVCFVRLGDT